MSKHQKVNHGYIYVILNPSFPQYFKIGYTTKDISSRLIRDHSITPENFVVLRFKEVADTKKREKELKELLKIYRHERGDGSTSEFFQIKCLQQCFEYLDKVNDTKEDLKKSKSKKNQKPRKVGDFVSKGLKKGDYLYFKKNHRYKVSIISPEQKQVEYKGNPMSISAAAQEIYLNVFNKKLKSADGFTHFCYKDGEVYKNLK